MTIVTAQLKQAIQERFRAFDTSGDGMLCKKELKDAFASMVIFVYFGQLLCYHDFEDRFFLMLQGKILTEQEMDELVLAYDIDNSNTFDQVLELYPASMILQISKRIVCLANSTT